MDRLQAFEAMLEEILTQSSYEKQQMDELKAQGKEKTATYKQYMGNRLVYSRMLAMYEERDLLP